MDEDLGQLEVVACPHYTDSKDDRCNLPSEVIRRDYVSSTDGPVEVILIRCVEGHFFAGPKDLMWS